MHVINIGELLIYCVGKGVFLFFFYVTLQPVVYVSGDLWKQDGWMWVLHPANCHLSLLQSGQ